MNILCAVLLIIILGLLIAWRITAVKLSEALAKLQEAAVLLNTAGEYFIKISEAVNTIEKDKENEEENE